MGDGGRERRSDMAAVGGVGSLTWVDAVGVGGVHRSEDGDAGDDDVAAGTGESYQGHGHRHVTLNGFVVYVEGEETCCRRGGRSRRGS